MLAILSVSAKALTTSSRNGLPAAKLSSLTRSKTQTLLHVAGILLTKYLIEWSVKSYEDGTNLSTFLLH